MYFIIIGFQILGFIALYYILRKKLLREIVSDSAADKVRDELNSIMVELNSTTDRNVAVIVDRIEQLKELLDRADKKITLLKREGEKHEVSSKIYSRIIANTPVKEPGGDRNMKLKNEVLKLHRAGFSAGVIAGHVGATVGEVELMISLDRKEE